MRIDMLEITKEQKIQCLDLAIKHYEESIEKGTLSDYTLHGLCSCLHDIILYDLKLVVGVLDYGNLPFDLDDGGYYYRVTKELYPDECKDAWWFPCEVGYLGHRLTILKVMREDVEKLEN